MSPETLGSALEIDELAVVADLVARVVDLNISDRAWMKYAKCKDMDPDIFYPYGNDGIKAAKAICRECLVSTARLSYALLIDEPRGVWGGASEEDRRHLKLKKKNLA